jgi:hypothetical protein
MHVFKYSLVNAVHFQHGGDVIRPTFGLGQESHAAEW